MTSLIIHPKWSKRAFCSLAIVSLSYTMSVSGGQKVHPTQKQWTEYGAEIPETILELQPFRESSSIRIQFGGGKEGSATLVNLNPSINTWYLLKIAWKSGTSEAAYHLENANPQGSKLLFDENYPSGLVIVEGKNRYFCELFGPGPANALDRARTSPLVFYRCAKAESICGKRWLDTTQLWKLQPSSCVRTFGAAR